MDPAQCSFCSGRGEEPAPVHDAASLSYVFTARYAGPCGWCGEWFEAGTSIRADPVNGGYAGEECWQ
jgi:hypothetical protein